VDTSYFIQLGFQDKASSDVIVADRVVVRLSSSDSEEMTLLSHGSRFAEGYLRSIASNRDPSSGLAINIDGGPALRPATAYTISVETRSQSGGILGWNQRSIAIHDG